MHRHDGFISFRFWRDSAVYNHTSAPDPRVTWANVRERGVALSALRAGWGWVAQRFVGHPRTL